MAWFKQKSFHFQNQLTPLTDSESQGENFKLFQTKIQKSFRTIFQKIHGTI